MSGCSARYVVVSPVKDEGRHVELTLRSMAAQTVKPARWVIVDDGSRDLTPAIVRRFIAEHPFVTLVDHPHAGARGPGSPVMRAFEFGRSCLGDCGYDFIVKLDCDLSFESDYFERLLSRFDEDPRLGIASGVYLEPDTAGEWRVVPMPGYHAFGASKVVRRQCFDAIGGFEPAAGWDTVDEIRAIHRGWRTAHFGDLEVRHHKREGSGIGQLRTSRLHGEIFYATGGDPLFFLLKTLHRIASRPVVAGAAALAVGYVEAALRRSPKLVTAGEARTYRRLLRGRLMESGRGLALLRPPRLGR